MVRQRFLYVNIFLWLNCCCSLIHGKFNNATWSALLYHRRAITCHRYHNRRARFQIICPPNKCVRGKWNSKQWKLLSVSNSMCVYMSTESQQVRKFNRITSSLVSKLISTKMHTLVCSLPLSLSLLLSVTGGITAGNINWMSTVLRSLFTSVVWCDKITSLIFTDKIKTKTFFSRHNMKIAQRVYSWADNNHSQNENETQKKLVENEWKFTGKRLSWWSIFYPFSKQYTSCSHFNYSINHNQTKLLYQTEPVKILNMHLK